MEKILVFILGAAIGSFLNVCIYRLPKGKSIVFPPSSCTRCGKQIAWFDNIPLVSYIMLGTRCRHCKGRIDFRYFLVEFLTAVLTTALFVSFWPAANFYSYSLLAWGLIVATFVDFEIQEIPDQISLGGIGVGILIALAFPSVMGEVSRLAGVWRSVAGALVGAGSIYAIGFFGELVFKKEAMGGGDVKLMAMIGAFLGWKFTLMTFFIAPFFGSVVGIFLKIKEGRDIIPYGPYLSLAALISIFFGDRILDLLFRTMM